MVQITLERTGRGFRHTDLLDLADRFGTEASKDFAADPVFYGSTLMNVEVTNGKGQVQTVIPSDMGKGIDTAMANADAITISYVTRAPNREPVTLTWKRSAPNKVTLGFAEGYENVRRAAETAPRLRIAA